MVKRHYRVYTTTQVASQKKKKTIQVIFPLKKKELYKVFKNLPVSEIKTARSRPWQTVFLKLTSARVTRNSGLHYLSFNQARTNSVLEIRPNLIDKISILIKINLCTQLFDTLSQIIEVTSFQ